MSNSLDLLAARTAQGITETVKPNIDKKLEKWKENQSKDNKTYTDTEKEEKQKKLAKTEPKDLENITTKALGVLQENGVYAGLLFLYARGEESYAKELREHLLESLGDEPVKKLELALPNDKQIGRWLDVGPHLVEKVCADLDTLFLVKQLWEQTLIYARYGAKAQGKE